MEICNYSKCTACKACKNICPQNAISFLKNKDGFEYPHIDTKKCIHCNLCKKFCINNSELKFFSPIEILAAWNKNIYVREESASGGVVTQLYVNALKKGFLCYGVRLNEEYKAEFVKIKEIKELKQISNSKYVYSDMKKIYIDIKENISKNKILFVGMPCQVAALKKFLNNKDENLITIDIVCHGMCPSEFFTNHIKYIINKYKIEDIQKISFRTNNIFDITIFSNKNKIVLKEKIDPYLIGYHTGILYREACYSCKFSKRERIGDITVCDYWNLNEYEKRNKEKGITGILINTLNGKKFFYNNKNNIVFEKKSVKGMEKIVALNKPQTKNRYRKKFEKNYIKYNDFEKAINKTLKFKILFNKIFFSNIVYTFKSQIKKFLKRG